MKTVIVDERISTSCERALMKEGFFVLKLPQDSALGEAVRSHPDTLMFCHGNDIITTADYCEEAAYVFSALRDFSPKIRQHFTAETRGKKYPYDAIMNAKVIGNTLFCKTDTVSRAILELAKQNGLSVAHTEQGYPACTTLALDDEHAITSDEGMARVMESHGINVTRITSGHIALPPYEYGFIGGASGVYKKKIYFFGDYTLHPDAKFIKKAIEDLGMTAVSLSDEQLTDFGGMLFTE